MPLIFRFPQNVYAAWRKDDFARANSSSGGLASVIAENWVKAGGVVYGAAFVKPFSFQHIRCTTMDELARLRGSKYVQSSINGIVSQIKEDIKKGIKVLFIGTPCQVAGIKASFKESVYAIEIICHGTPKQETLRESIPDYVLGLDFDRIDFRDDNNFRLTFKKGQDIVWTRPLAHDLYMKGFFKALFYRDCCYSCKYAKPERISDMTLGDFWGVDAKSINTNIEKGVSLVFVNTENGTELFNLAKKEIEYVARPLTEALAGNKQLRHPMPLTWRHRLYKVLYPILGFKWSCRLCMPDIMIKNLFK